MYDEIGKKDENSSTVLMGVTDDVYQAIRMLRVDPVTGRLLISATGGSSGSGYQVPTGTVDGSNQTFTFSTAPNAIVVDNNNLMQTQQDGTVNWTGTTTIILAVAPNSYIYAVA